MKAKLKMLFRNPIKFILLTLLLGIVSFGFVSKTVEYLIITDAVEEISGYYKTIGFLTSTETDGYDVTDGAKLIGESDLVEINDVSRRCDGRLEEIYNGDLRSGFWYDLGQYGTWDSVFWGKLVDKQIQYADPEVKFSEDIYTFRFWVTEKVLGYPEYTPVGEYVTVSYSTREAENSFIEEFESLVINSLYCVRAAFKGTSSYNYGYSLKQIIDDGSWFLEESESFMLDSIIESDKIQELNRHKVWIYTTKDLSASPFTQESLKDGYLIDGRWLTAEDQENANPVCVITKRFADARNLNVGDTLKISLPDEQIEDLYYPIGTTIDNVTKEVVTIDFMIVGIFDETGNELDLLNTVSSLTILIPDSCMPEEYDYATRNFEKESVEKFHYGFVLKSPELEDEFVKEYKEKLESMGYTLHMIENGWQSFWNTAEPLCQSAKYNAIMFLAIQIITLILTAYLYFKQHFKEFAISRALGIPKGRIFYWDLLSALLLGILGIGIGGVVGWNYSLVQIQDTLLLLQENGKNVSENLSVMVLSMMIIGSLIVFLVSVIIYFYVASRQSVLEILQGTKTNRKFIEKKNPKTETSKTLHTSEVILEKREFIYEYNLSNDENKEAKKWILQFLKKHLLRNRGNSILLIILAVMLLFAQAWLLQSIHLTAENIDRLYQGISVEADVMLGDLTTLSSLNYISDTIVDQVMQSGFVEETSLMTVQRGRNLSNIEGKKEIKSFTLCGITDPEDLNVNSLLSSGGTDELKYGKITYQEGLDESLLKKDYTEITEGYPIIISKDMMDQFDANYGDQLTIYRGTKDVSVQIVGSYEGIFTNVDTAYGDLAIMPASALKVINNDTLYYSKVGFTIDSSKNRELDEFRELLENLAENDTSSKAKIKFKVWDEELRMTAEPMEKNLTLMKVLYPIAQIVAMLAGGMVSMLLLLQSAKRAAILRVLGIPAKTVRKMLGAEQLILGVIGTVLGILLCVILGKWNIELLYSIGLYLLGLMIGTMIGCILVTNRKPLELLQVRE